ncbi:hypothetical protein NE237_020858 [Protea cynaroides]|uniref:non-specific serine/threonine protein kinase n=1 Tax=Protea cynaroides TaxID=273540 RepID=A0A9Q0K4B5_9MAGN|nr:hypothetical protein NE237_020858 [Protea cynaroides]
MDSMSIVPANVLRNLADKLYDKRKNAALEVFVSHPTIAFSSVYSLSFRVLICLEFLNFATTENLALKVMLKALIEKKFKDNGDKDIGSPFRRIFERDVLKSFRHPLPPRLREVVETDKIIGLAIDYCPGKDLSCLRNNQTEKMFSDDIIR